MRPIILAATLLGGTLSLVTLDTASSLPGLSTRPASFAGLVQEVKTQRYRKAGKYGYGVPTTFPTPARARTNSAIGSSIRRSATRSRPRA